MALTGDTHVYRYGSGDDCQPTSYGLGATQTVYNGEVALLSGSGSTTTGYLKNAASPGNADLVVGMLEGQEVATGAQTGPGVVGGTTDGAIWASVREGTYFIQSDGSLSAATNGKTVYYKGENTTGPLAASTGSGTYPVLGVQVPQDPGIAGGFSPGANFYPIKLTTIGTLY